MKNLVLILFFPILTMPNYILAQSQIIKGKVSSSNQVLVNAEVLVSSSNAKVKTDLNGSYQVSADKGDILTFLYPGMITVEIVVEDVTSILNISMNQKFNELDEVVVKGSNRKSQSELEKEYILNKNLIRTAFGILDKETAPGNIRFLHEDEINSIGLCILDLVRNEFPGVQVSGNCVDGGIVTIRGFQSLTKSTPAIYDVDGMIFTNTPLWIMPGNIHRIAILNNLATTTRYGSIASGGAIIINTKSASPDNNKVIDLARLTNNYFQNDAIDTKTVSSALPKYLKELEASDDIEEAKEVYEKYNVSYGNSPYYQIDAYRFFVERGEISFADEIFSGKKDLLLENPIWAKAIAYHMDAFESNRSSLDIYKQIFILRPEYAQSYRDLALSYSLSGKYKSAAGLYARYQYLRDKGFLVNDTSEIAQIIEREFDTFIALNGNEISDEYQQKRNANFESELQGTRLFFEWNDGEAEFDLQFVNPENQFYTWNHSSEANPARIHSEKVKGYSCEEFFVDDSMSGLWQVNINYKGNKRLKPTYMKVTSFTNYGEKNQSQKTKVYRLGLKNQNQKLFTLFHYVSVID